MPWKYCEREKTGQAGIITDHGKPTLEIRKLRQQVLPPLMLLKGTVVKYENAAVSVAVDDWENA